MTRTTLAIALAGLMYGNAAFAQKISFDFDRSAPFARFKSYAWVAGTNVPEPLIHRRIVNAVDSELVRRGLAPAQPGERPDVLVAYHASFERDLQVTGFGSGWGGYRFGGQRAASARAEQILVGTLIVDLIDAGSNLIVWRGTATKDIDVNANADKRDKNIARTAERLFKNYPPKP